MILHDACLLYSEHLNDDVYMSVVLYIWSILPVQYVQYLYIYCRIMLCIHSIITSRRFVT